ncbi:hypothetical protein [Gracilimonas sp.]|uniref:hypothetical protein n=1 Tax=Gracilimonas sp. TaxID=1974203 RepID=UPI002871F280|nr:hypothetical protein [Gracilimonas sp.]
MKTNILLVVLFLGLLLNGCGSEDTSTTESSGIYVDNPEYGVYQEEPAPPFSFEHVDTITPEFTDDFILSGFNQMLTDPEGNIYFMDSRQSKLLSLNSEGNLRWMTGEEGRGPGDFESAYSMITDGDQLYVGNLQGSRLDVFNYEGDFQKSYNLAEKVSFGTLWGFLSGGEIVMAAPNWDSWGPHIHIVEIEGDTIRTTQDFTIDQSGDIETIQGMTSRSSISVYANRIYTGSIIDYSIEVHDTSGTLTRKIRRDFDRIVRPGMYSDGGSSTIRGFGKVEAPQFLPNEYFIVQAIWPTNVNDPDRYTRLSNNGTAPELEYAHSIDIFNPEGQLLYSFEGEGFTPKIGEIAHIDENGIIYTTGMDEEAPIIKKYRLVLNDEYQERIDW